MTAETFPALLQRLYSEQYTGPIVVQFGQGVPSVVEIPCTPTRIRLDKAPKPRILDSNVTVAPDPRGQ